MTDRDLFIWEWAKEVLEAEDILYTHGPRLPLEAIRNLTYVITRDQKAADRAEARAFLRREIAKDRDKSGASG